MSGLRSEDGLVHVVSDGPSPSRLFALCDIVQLVHRPNLNGDSFSYVGAPSRNWGPGDVVDAIPSCLACIVVVREAIGG